MLTRNLFKSALKIPIEFVITLKKHNNLKLFNQF